MKQYPRAVILSALTVEYGVIRTHLRDLHEKTHPAGTMYDCGIFRADQQTWEVLLGSTNKGNVNAAFEAGRAIEYFQPDVVLFVGVAGGLRDVYPGDIVVATEIYAYEVGKDGQFFEARPKLNLPTYPLLQRAKYEANVQEQRWLKRLATLPERHPQVLTGPIAAGEKVLASTRSATWRFLREHYSEALAVEMEGFGFLQAAYANPVEALVIRGISNLGDKDEQVDPAGSQKQAIQHAAAFAFEVLARFHPQQAQASRQQPETTARSGHIVTNHAPVGQQFIGDRMHLGKFIVSGDSSKEN